MDEAVILMALAVAALIYIDPDWETPAGANRSARRSGTDAGGPRSRGKSPATGSKSTCWPRRAGSWQDLETATAIQPSGGTESIQIRTRLTGSVRR
jgi:hypothetical protein